MEPNSILPLLATAVIVVIIASVVAAIVLWWDTRPGVRRIVRRTWFVVTVFGLLAVVIFWISTMFGASDRATVDRSLQQKQKNELHQRLKAGGH
jgi:predicted PurR-regulated permease PerM